MLGVRMRWTTALYRRGYRDPDLTDLDAQHLMLETINELTSSALRLRRRLLGMGFADSHMLCRELDQLSGYWEGRYQSQRRAYIELSTVPAEQGDT